MAIIERFEDIRAWQIARELVGSVYQIVAKAEDHADAELRRQLTAAAISVMSNIAEGFGRGNDGDFARFLDIARGSAAEVQSLSYVAQDVGYLREADATALRAMAVDCVVVMASLQRYLKRTRRTPRS